MKRSVEVEVDDRLSHEPFDVDKLEAYLQRINFLDPSLGVREQQQKRDPMLIVLYDPCKRVMLPDGTETTIIDDLLRSGHEQFKRAYGSMYSDFEMIQYTMEVLIASGDVHAKQMAFLCMLAVDQGFCDQFQQSYPKDGGPEAARLAPFVLEIKKQMDETLNTAYHNVPRPSKYNVDGLLRTFLLRCAEAYPG